jgi:multicomponent Na+:H+ antiporter subunit A
MTTPILETGTRAVFHTILLFSIYMLFAGHNAPGGGFIGGLIAASAIVLRATAEGSDDIRKLVPVDAEAVLGAGALIAVLTGAAGFVLGAGFLDSTYFEADLPVLGHVKVVSVLFFDIGVYLVVLGLGLVLVRTLGGDAGIADDDTEDDLAEVRP